MKTSSPIFDPPPRRGRRLRPAAAALVACWPLLIMLFLGSTRPALAQGGTTVSLIEAVPDADNSDIQDEDGDTPAYVVLEQSGQTNFSIGGWSLVITLDGAVFSWVFPTNAIIDGEGRRLLVFASGKDRTKSPYATSFTINCGDIVRLFNAEGALVSSRPVAGRSCRDCIQVIRQGTPLRYHVPVDGINPSWNTAGFTGDANWPRGANCLGYDGAPISNNLILYSTFDRTDVDTTNRIVFDMSGPTVHNGSYDSLITIPVGGQIGEAAEFPGNTTSSVGYVGHPELDVTTNNYTFSIWVRPSGQSPAAQQPIFNKGATDGTTEGYEMWKNGDAGVGFRLVGTGGANTVTVGSAAPLPSTAWTHLLVVINRTAGAMRLYRNGVQADQQTIPAGISYAGVGDLFVGRRTLQRFAGFSGRLDDFAIWGRELSVAEINQVYEDGAAGRSFTGGSTNLYGPLITTQVGPQMKGVNTTIYVRIPFTIPDASLVDSLTLNMMYDDGFVAYINGEEVARRNAPTGALNFQSAAATDRPDNDALTAEQIDLSAFINKLVTGPNNVLAIQGLNFVKDDPRFLLCPELCHTEREPNSCYYTTNGRNFWIAFPGNAADEPSHPLGLNVCIAGVPGTTGLVAVPGLGYSQVFSIPAAGSVTVEITPEASLDKSDTVENKGVHILATAEVAVYARSRIDYSTDSYLALPTRCLGSEYLVLGYSNKWTGHPDLNGSQFAIVATQDDTRVTVVPRETTGLHPAGVPYDFILDQGETYLLRNLRDAPADLSGTEVTSDKPIGVFGGHRCANIYGQTFFCDHIVEQMLPVPLWSTEYVAAPLQTRNESTFRMVASQDGTVFSINGVAVANRNRGGVFETARTGGAVITANQPFLAAQYSPSSDHDLIRESDPFQIDLQPTRSWLPVYRFCTPAASEFPDPRIDVVGTSASLAAVSMNPAPLSLSPITPLSGSYSYRSAKLAPNTTYTVGNATVGLAIYGWGDEFDSFGHSGGMGFDDFLPPTFTNCPKHITVFLPANTAAAKYTVPNYATELGVTDDCCPVERITVTQDPFAGSQLGIGDYGVTVIATDCNQNRVVCNFTLHVRGNWQQENFPNAYPIAALEATVWGWGANPDGDRLPNRAEYALGTDPNVPNRGGDIGQSPPGPIPVGTPFSAGPVTESGDTYLEISFRTRLDDPSIEYIPESSSNLNQARWNAGPGHFQQVSVEPDAQPGFNRVRVRALGSSFAENRQHFLRLRIRTR